MDAAPLGASAEARKSIPHAFGAVSIIRGLRWPAIPGPQSRMGSRGFLRIVSGSAGVRLEPGKLAPAAGSTGVSVLGGDSGRTVGAHPDRGGILSASSASHLDEAASGLAGSGDAFHAARDACLRNRHCRKPGDHAAMAVVVAASAGQLPTFHSNVGLARASAGAGANSLPPA